MSLLTTTHEAGVARIHLHTGRGNPLSPAALEALEDTLSRNGFVYEKSVEDSKTIEMVLHVAQGP